MIRAFLETLVQNGKKTDEKGKKKKKILKRGCLGIDQVDLTGSRSPKSQAFGHICEELSGLDELTVGNTVP